MEVLFLIFAFIILGIIGFIRENKDEQGINKPVLVSLWEALKSVPIVVKETFKLIMSFVVINLFGTVVAFLVVGTFVGILYLLGLFGQQSPVDIDEDVDTFMGYDCKQDCSGHWAGYEWAEKKDIDDVDTCWDVQSTSFAEGCEAYVTENY